MSYDTAKYTNLVQGQKKAIFSWWYVDNTDQYSMMGCYSPYARNFRVKGASVQIRPWHQFFKTLASGDYPRWIWSYLRANTANNVLVIRHNISSTKKLYTLKADWTLTEVTTDSKIASDNRMRFVNVWDVVYCMNGVDHYWMLNGVTYTHPTTWVSWLAPSFWVVFSWKMVVSGRSSNPNKVYYSKADDYWDFNSSWAVQATFQEQLTGLCSTGQALFYFTPNTISVTDKDDIVNTGWVITYNSIPLQVKEWAYNHDCIVWVGNSVYYLSNAMSIKKIQRNTSNMWFETMDLSDRPSQGITNFMWRIDKNQPDAFGRFYPQENLIKWFFRWPWSTFNDICVVYDLVHDAFYVDSNKYFYDSVFFDGYNYAISTLEPKVYIDEYWYDDEWSPTPFEYRTKEFYVSGQFKNILRESRTLVDINELAVLEQKIYIDWRQIDTKTIDKDNIPFSIGWIWTSEIWTAAIWVDWPSKYDIWLNDDLYEVQILRTRGNLNKLGTKIQYRFSCWQVGAKLALKTVMPKLETKPPIITPLTE